MRVVLFDEHHLARRGLEQMLSGADLVEIVASTASTEMLDRMVTEQAVDLVLISTGATFSDRDAFSRLRMSGVATLVLARSDAPEHLDVDLRRGATGCLIGEAFDVDDVAGAIRKVSGLPPPADAQPTRKTTSSRSPAERLLTPREQQILRYIAQGLSNPEIASRLGMKVHGVKRSVSLVMATLGCSNRVAAAVRAVEEGWLTRATEPVLILGIDATEVSTHATQPGGGSP